MTDALLATLRAIGRDANGYATVGADPGGSVRAMLRRYLHDYANGLCVVCGQHTDLSASPREWHRAEAGHIIAAGGNRRGYVPGNLGNMCVACNKAAGDRDLTEYVPRFARPDLIPTEWPRFTKSTVDYTEQQSRFTIRKHNGLPF